MYFRQLIQRFLTAICGLLMMGQLCIAEDQPLVVFAASSLKGALDEMAQASGQDVRISYASSALLARQISQGAQADLFISANSAWMDWAEGQGAIAADTRVDLLTNRLVLVSPDAAHPELELSGATQLQGGIVAMGQINAVPAGIYGKAALEALGLWDGLAGRIAQAESVRHALALVALGEAAYGVVYASDAQAEPKVHVVAEFAPALHPPILYPAALTAQTNHPDALPFLQSLATPEARTVFERHGFGWVDGASQR